MSYMPPTDAMFLIAETREHPMHVGGLQLLKPPPDAGPDFVHELIDSFRADDHVSPTFRRRPAQPLGTLGNTWWALDETIDSDYHIRHSAIPNPGRVRELLQLVSRLHGSLLDRHRPMWEAHVVEGLADGRIAVYSKIHHSLVDGVSALRLMSKSLSEDPDARDCLPPWASRSVRSATTKSGFNPIGLVKGGLGIVGDVAGLAPASLKIVNQIVRDGDLALPRAPRSMINVPVGGARRFAAQSWELDRIQRVARSSGTTLNDVVLAMVSGALRGYLLEQNALPQEPMTAMVPVSLALRSESAGKEGGGGNSVGMIIVNLATDQADGATRLEEISYSAKQAKKIMAGLSPMQILAFSALQMAPITFAAVPGFLKYGAPPFNVVVSNVPGPRKETYFNGAKLDGLYPVSIVTDGLALNITLCSRDKYLDFGLIGCRKSVPHLQRLLFHLEESIAELEKSWG